MRCQRKHTHRQQIKLVNPLSTCQLSVHKATWFVTFWKWEKQKPSSKPVVFSYFSVQRALTSASAFPLPPAPTSSSAVQLWWENNMWQSMFSHGPCSPANHHTKYFHMCLYSACSLPVTHSLLCFLGSPNMGQFSLFQLFSQSIYIQKHFGFQSAFFGSYYLICLWDSCWRPKCLT